MREPEIAKVIRDIEQDPLFQKLLMPPSPEFKVIRYQAHPRSQLSSRFYELNEAIVPNKAPSDMTDLFSRYKKAVALIQKIGQELFEKHFLFAESSESVDAVASLCGLKPGEVDEIRQFLLSFSVHTEFFDPSEKSPPAGLSVIRIARLHLQSDDDVSYEFLSPHLARGRYAIDYDNLQSLIKKGAFTPEEKRHVKQLLKRMELLNWRQSSLFRIMDLLCHTQRQFFKTRVTDDKTPISQRQLAKKLTVAPSTICRTVQGRSLLLPWGEEVLMEDLFYSHKSFLLARLEDLREQDPDFDKKTDKELQKELQTRYGLTMARRTVNAYKHQIDSPKKSK